MLAGAVLALAAAMLVGEKCSEPHPPQPPGREDVLKANIWKSKAGDWLLKVSVVKPNGKSWSAFLGSYASAAEALERYERWASHVMNVVHVEDEPPKN